ncbi:Pentatricopeptide repeat-containing protein, mitochondrial, partial [Cucurbita argyrosperma subsp. argyrosperma]
MFSFVKHEAFRSMTAKSTVTLVFKQFPPYNFKLHPFNFSTQNLQNRESFDSARIQKSSKFLVYCNSQITKLGRNGCIKEAESVFNRMPHKSTVSWTAMLTAYAENGEINKAQEVFDKMPDRSIASYNAMITAYHRRNMVNEAFELFSSMPQRNSVSYATMITGFVRVGMFEMAEKLHWENPGMVSSNVLINGYLKARRIEDAVRIFDGMEEKGVVSWSSMIDGLCKVGKIVGARKLFDKMLERNVVTWTTMINGYMKMGNFKDGFTLFLNMRRERVEVNATTLTVLFEACGCLDRYREGIQIHGLVLSLGLDFDAYLANSMIAMYSRCHSINAAATIFDLMVQKDIVTWNSLIAGYVQSGDIEKAFLLFENMPQKDVVSWTTLISGFASKGMIDKSIGLFQMMPEKDDIAWTAVISGLVSNEEYETAFHWFIEMLQKAIKPNPLTLSCVLSAAAGVAILSQGLQFHALVTKMSMEYDLSIQNSLVSMYSKCGNVGDALRMFYYIESPNVVTYNSIITGLAQNGLGKESLKLFTKMQDEYLEPNQITFLGVLSACVHVGFVEEGWRFFNLMSSLYNIQPQVDHYACMVDLLCRAGMFNEAVELISSMPFDPHEGVWGAMLGASWTHLRLDVAELAAHNLFELEPNSATPYVILSNLHSVSGDKRKDEVIRSMKISKGIKKSPGCSWIIVKDKIHLFYAGDRSHKDIEEMTEIIHALAAEIGDSIRLRETT